MQVSTLPSPTPLPTSSTVEPAAKEDRAPPPKRKGEAAAPDLERALAQAAGLDPEEAQQVRVTLSVDQTTNQVVARVVNKDTGELVRQVPTEQVIRNAVLVHEMLGATLNKQV